MELLAAVKTRGYLAEKSAGQHGCKRETAALTAIAERIRLSTASRVRCAGLSPALDPAPSKQFSSPISWLRQITAGFDRH